MTTVLCAGLHCLSHSGKWQQLSHPRTRGSDDALKVTTNGFMVVLAWSSYQVVSALTSGFSNTPKIGVVTKVGASPRELLEIDGRPAAEVYNEWDEGRIRSTAVFGDDGMANILSSSSFAPLAEPLGFKQCRVLHPAFIERDSGCITLFADVKKGMKIQMMNATADTLIENIPESAMALMKQETTHASNRCIGALMIFCGGLVMAIDDDMPLVCERLAAMVGYQDHLGICCFGEQGKMLHDGVACHGNLMFGCMLFYDIDSVAPEPSHRSSSTSAKLSSHNEDVELHLQPHASIKEGELKLSTSHEQAVANLGFGASTVKRTSQC